MFKNLANGDLHPRKKHLIDLEIDISSATRCAAIIFELRPYFIRNRPMGASPYILQLQNATVDLETNTIRHTSPFDYASKQSLIRVPDYALPGASDLREPAEAEKDRRWVLDFVWSISRPDPTGKPHDLDAHHILGGQDKTNSYFLLFLLARLLEGVPIKKTIFFFSPRGGNSKKPIEELIRYVLGSYSALCKNSLYTADKKSDESNSSVSLSRESIRCLFGQEIDRDSHWCNAVFKRRSDCGREGGTRKHSNVVQEYEPVYTVLYGCNEPPLFTQPPGGSEIDRTLVIYLPNKFCDSSDLNERPVSPRRFPKNPSVDSLSQSNNMAWALLQILLHIRRSVPNLDQIIANGTPTSRNHIYRLPNKETA